MQLWSVEHFLKISSKLDSPVCNQNIGEGESNFDKKNVQEMFKKCSTDQSCIQKRNTTYKIGTLVELIDVTQPIWSWDSPT